jgi:hypothetical protein
VPLFEVLFGSGIGDSKIVSLYMRSTELSSDYKVTS